MKHHFHLTNAIIAIPSDVIARVDCSGSVGDSTLQLALLDKASAPKPSMFEAMQLS